MIGPLPAGFLRLTTEREIQESADRQAAIALYQAQNATYMVNNFLKKSLFQTAEHFNRISQIAHFSRHRILSVALA